MAAGLLIGRQQGASRDAGLLDAAWPNVDSLRELDNWDPAMDAAGVDQPHEASLDELRRQVETLRASLTRAVEAGDELRRRVERSLHDGVQQQLVALGVNLQLASRLGEEDHAALRSRLDEIARDAQQALVDVRQLAWTIYPSLLLDRGLAEALRESTSQVDLRTHADVAGVGRYPRDIEAGVYFACLDALHAAAAHVGPEGRASVRLRVDGRMLLLDVCVHAAPGSWEGRGLSGVADRVAAVGGRLSVASDERGSVCVNAAIPLER